MSGNNLIKKTAAVMEMIKYQHSIHTLPFVYLGAFLANKSFPGWEILGWITLGMVNARSLAMGLNRYIDREIDSRNPRTAERALPKGLLSEKECLVFCSVSALLCLLATWHLPSLIWALAPVIFLLFIFYPHTKRFTWSCHFWLGLTMALAPLGGWVAVSNTISPPILLLMAAVFFFISGSELVYACQDMEVDRKEGLFSIPAVFGIDLALKVTKIFHVLCFVSLAGFGAAIKLNAIYYIGVALAGAFTLSRSLPLKPAGISMANKTFVSINAVVGLVVLISSLSSLWIGSFS